MVGTTKQLIIWLAGQNTDKQFEVSPYHKKRSLDANAYCWLLCTKIADTLLTTKEDIYLQMIKKYAPSILIAVRAEKEVKGFFIYYELFETSTINNKPADYYRVWKGSSDMDASEMAKFIDCIIEDAKEMDIETLPPSEIKRLKEMWK
jgi:hypothetical protein